jgi:hypothetical protein
MTAKIILDEDMSPLLTLRPFRWAVPDCTHKVYFSLVKYYNISDRRAHISVPLVLFTQHSNTR